MRIKDKNTLINNNYIFRYINKSKKIKRGLTMGEKIKILILVMKFGRIQILFR